jgi:hypothetical protein
LSVTRHVRYGLSPLRKSLSESTYSCGKIVSEWLEPLRMSAIAGGAALLVSMDFDIGR